MKEAITLITILLNFGYTQAQAPAIQWQKSFGGTADETAYAIQTTTDGGYVVAGRSNSINWDVTGNHGGNDYWVAKLDATGIIQWQKSLGGSSNDVSRSIQTTSDGGYILAGYSNSTDGDVTGNHGNDDCWVVKLDATGNIQWQKSLGGSQGDAAYSIQTTSDGGYVVAGYTNSINGDITVNYGVGDYWVVKLDANGAIQWQKSLGGSSIEGASSIHTTSDGGYILAGFSLSNNGNVSGEFPSSDYWVLKLDAIGNIQWQKSMGGTRSETQATIQTTSDGGYVVAGISDSIDGDVTGNHGGWEYWVVKLDVNGIIQWQKCLGGTADDFANSIQTTLDGGFIVAGITNSTNGDVTGNNGAYDYWIVKLDVSGSILWQKSIGGLLNDFARDIQTTSDGGYIIVGDSNSLDGNVAGNHGGTDFWIVKLAPDVLATTVFKNDVIVIYPNPVCDILQIQTPANTTITSAKIITINGQVVLEHTQNSNTINVENLLVYFSSPE